MESKENARELLRLAARAEAAPWTDHPPTPAWYPLGVGVWAAALVLAAGVLDGVGRAVAIVALALVEGAFLGWYRRYRGTLPKGPMPAELRPAALRLIAGLAVVAVAAIICLLVDWPVVAAVIVLVAVVPLIWWYERAYAAAMVATRARLA